MIPLDSDPLTARCSLTADAMRYHREVSSRTTLAFFLLGSLASACTSGTLFNDGDSGCLDGGCDDADRSDADLGGDRPDPCESMECGPGLVCRDGHCETPDLCDGVVCANAGEVCDPRDGNCYSGATDDDEDGFTIAEGDCDDGEPSIHPGAPELCDGIDQDCDRIVDEDFPDADGDGYDICGAGIPEQADCDDSAADRHPFFAEICDGVDNDCNDAVDDGIENRPCETDCGTGEERCEGGEWVCSAPDSCECTPAGLEEDDVCGNCGTRQRTCQDDLTWTEWSACAGEGLCAPGSASSQPCGNCGTQWRSCSSSCDWEGWGACESEGPCSPGATASCTTTCSSTGTMTCGGTCRYGDCLPPAESCNLTDDDCDGDCDEGCRQPVHRATCPGGDHFYTTDASEISALGCSTEHLDYFYTLATAVSGSRELWRCYSSGATDHFYTLSSTCEGASHMTLEGHIGWVVASATCGAVPLYRLYSSSAGDHFYTTSTVERDMAIAGGWTNEGIEAYVWTGP